MKEIRVDPESGGSAESLILELQNYPRGLDLAAIGKETRWVFRGQSKADWTLTPSAHRANGSGAPQAPEIGRLRDRVLDRMERVPGHRFMAWAAAEYALIVRFAELIDRLGLHLPLYSSGDSIALDQLVEDMDDYIREGYSDRKFEPEVVALGLLAQHHGVPTRFLDWTRDPLAALWFASSSGEGDFAVFALRESSRRKYRGRGEGAIRFHWAPSWLSPYIHRQQGMFTSTTAPKAGYPASLDDSGWPSVEDVLRHRFPSDAGSYLVKTTISASLREDVTDALRNLGYSAASLMPSLDNAAKQVLREARL
ncbi:MAG: FRG domain-containing protein [Planctomycetota bacterium]